MSSITYSLVCFLANIDFTRNFVKYLPSKDIARLIIVCREFNPKYIMRLIKQDYKFLYSNFISQREKYYPLIFSFHFKYHNVDTLSEFLATETINNLISNKPMIYFPDQLHMFNTHDKKIREILYQCFSLYLSKPIQIVEKDGAISFDEVGSIIFWEGAIIDRNGTWADSFEDGVYSNRYALTDRYDNNGNIDHLGIYDENGIAFSESLLYDMNINSLFVLLHKFDIKLKNKLIVDKIVISPFEQEIDVNNLCPDLRADVLYPHHINCFYGNIEENLKLITRENVMNKEFYALIAAVPTGIANVYPPYYEQYKTIYTLGDKTIFTNILGNDVNKYQYMLTDGSVSDEAIINRLVNCNIMARDVLQNNLQPHLKTKQYNVNNLLDYVECLKTFRS